MVFDSFTGGLFDKSNLVYMHYNASSYTVQAIIFTFIFLIPAIICKCIANYINSKQYKKVDDYELAGNEEEDPDFAGLFVFLAASAELGGKGV